MKKTHKIGGTNVLLTVLLFLGCLTVLFPLYMTVMIAFKSPTEMTNDIAVLRSLCQTVLEPFFKVAPILCTGQQCRQIQCKQLHLL